MVHSVDPVAFAESCGITPDSWQASLLRSDARRALLLCSRQSGKSTVTALLGLHCAMYQAGTVVIASPSLRQSTEMLRTVRGFLAVLGASDVVLAESVTKLEFKNGARILATPGDEKTIRGISGVSLVIVDEAARVEDELLAAVAPMLATTNGRLIALTTPAGKRGWFHDQWHGDNDWLCIKVAASDCPRISKKFLGEELKNLGAMRFSEEYSLTFVDNDESAFPTAVIDAAFTSDVVPLWQ
jgi:hypothetical protein